MEVSPTLVYLGVLTIGCVVWLVRIEAKALTTERDVNDLKKHAADKSIHHDIEYLDARFEKVEAGIEAVVSTAGEIKTSISRVNDRLDLMLTK